MMGLASRGVVTANEGASLEQKLSTAITYTKHEHPQKAVAAIDDLIAALGRSTVHEEPAEKTTVSRLAQSAKMLQELLTQSKLTVTIE
jgi:hypothetical protein